MTTYTVSSQQMLAASDQADAISQKMSTTLAGLEDRLKSTLASWTSEGQQQYQIRQSQWQAAAHSMPTTLAGAKQILSDILHAYTTGETRVTQTFS
jgi:uncharacterized protein YukE